MNLSLKQMVRDGSKEVGSFEKMKQREERHGGGHAIWDLSALGDRLLWGSSSERVGAPRLWRVLQIRQRCRNLTQEGNADSLCVPKHWRHNNLPLQLLRQRGYTFSVEIPTANVLSKMLIIYTTTNMPTGP